MRVFGSAADYLDRKFDLLALRGAEPVGESLLSQSLFGADAAGEVCTGVQKLAQRWLLHFATERGSMRFLSSRGVDFMTEAARGLFRTELDVVQSFNIAELEVRRVMRNEEGAEDHPEDRLQSASLTAIAISEEQLSLTVAITSLAGSARKIVLPIPYSPLRTGF